MVFIYIYYTTMIGCALICKYSYNIMCSKYTYTYINITGTLVAEGNACAISTSSGLNFCFVYPKIITWHDIKENSAVQEKWRGGGELPASGFPPVGWALTPSPPLSTRPFDMHPRDSTKTSNQLRGTITRSSNDVFAPELRSVLYS